MTAGLNTGNAKAALAERGDDLYETPAVATEALLRVESLPEIIWEPACGPGSIVRTLRAAGHKVYATDLVDYGCPDSEARVDFLMEHSAPTYIGAIVTNPPFKLANQFVAHGLMLAPKVIMLLRLAFLEGTGRSPIMDGGSLARVYVFRNRLPMMHRAGRGTMVAKTNSSAMAFAWFVWDRTHSGPTEMRRISWGTANLAETPGRDTAGQVELSDKPAKQEAFEI